MQKRKEEKEREKQELLQRLKKDIITRLSKSENSSAFINDTIKNICIKVQALAYDIFDIEFNRVENAAVKASGMC